MAFSSSVIQQKFSNVVPIASPNSRGTLYPWNLEYLVLASKSWIPCPSSAMVSIPAKKKEEPTVEKRDHIVVLEKGTAGRCWGWKATHQRGCGIDPAAVAIQIALFQKLEDILKQRFEQDIPAGG